MVQRLRAHSEPPSRSYVYKSLLVFHVNVLQGTHVGSNLNDQEGQRLWYLQGQHSAL